MQFREIIIIKVLIHISLAPDNVKRIITIALTMKSFNTNIFEEGKALQRFNNFAPEVYCKEEPDKEVFFRENFITNPTYAYEILFKKHYEVLCNYAVKYVCTCELAEDIVGEVFYKIWDKKFYLNINTSYKAYLFTAVRNTSINYLKKECVRGKRDSGVITEEFIFYNDPYNIILAKELNHSIVKSIQLLTSKCQRVFILSRYEGKKNREIAFELNVSVKAVEAHISKALAIIKETLRENNFFNND